MRRNPQRLTGLLAGLFGLLLALGTPLTRTSSGGRLAFTVRNGAGTDIYTLALNGATLQRVTHDDLSENNVRWSPDGTRLAYIASRPRNADDAYAGAVYLALVDGGGAPQPIPNTSGATALAWSPDGVRLAVASVFNGTLYTLNLDGTDQVMHYEWDPLAVWDPAKENRGSRATAPTFTPDGRGVLFGLEDEPDFDLNGTFFVPTLPTYDLYYVALSGGTPEERLPLGSFVGDINWLSAEAILFGAGLTSPVVQRANLRTGTVADVAAGHSPALSPDKTQVAYVGNRPLNRTILLLDLPRNITITVFTLDDALDITSLDWAP